jgi:hypothetical protein
MMALEISLHNDEKDYPSGSFSISPAALSGAQDIHETLVSIQFLDLLLGQGDQPSQLVPLTEVNSTGERLQISA